MRIIKLWLVPRVVVALLVTTGAAQPSVPSGLRGLVTRSPITPVCKQGLPCSAPARNTTLVFKRNGSIVRTRTGNDGRYRVVLAPGSWSVQTGQIPRIGTGVRPGTVRVITGRFRVVNLNIDTGIR
jgi:hypothetical protein